MEQCKLALIGLVGLTFATWIVSLAGIASLQAQCDVPTAFGALDCGKAFRYEWFIIWLQFFVILVVGWVATNPKGPKGRTAAVGLLAVVTLLYIGSTNSFLRLTDTLGDDDKWGARVKTSLAGFLMTSALDLLLILTLGWECTEQAPAAAKATGEAAV